MLHQLGIVTVIIIFLVLHFERDSFGPDRSISTTFVDFHVSASSEEHKGQKEGLHA